jgi:hypothetical protein
MGAFLGFFAASLLFLFPMRDIFASEEVLISEIAWMGSLPKSGQTANQAANDEWIELFNGSVSNISLEGWTLGAEDGTPAVELSGSIAPTGFFLLERTSDDTVPAIAADQIYGGALSNAGERLFLKNASGALIDEVNALSGWPAGDNTTKDTMQRVENVWVTASPTPRAAYSSSSSISPSPPASLSSPSPPAHSSSAFPPLSFTVSAGEDRVFVAGQEAEFLGKAEGFRGEPLDQARFLWNFGDGSSAEGKHARHVFLVPGSYLVGLHVSSGNVSSGDYAAVTVVPNKIRIAGVVGGEGGFLRLVNGGGDDIDISGWILEEEDLERGEKKFVFPPYTRIARGAEASIPNAHTGLFKFFSGKNPVILRYSNGVAAVRFDPNEKEENSAVPPAVSSSSVPLQEKERAGAPGGRGISSRDKRIPSVRESAAILSPPASGSNPASSSAIEKTDDAVQSAGTFSNFQEKKGRGAWFFASAVFFSLGLGAYFFLVRKYVP